MATKRISELSELLSASLSTVVAGVDGGSTYKISIDTIKTAIGATTIDTGSFVTNSQTASFATTGSNQFVGTQNIIGGITLSNPIPATLDTPAYLNIYGSQSNNAMFLIPDTGSSPNLMDVTGDGSWVINGTGLTNELVTNIYNNGGFIYVYINGLFPGGGTHEYIFTKNILIDGNVIEATGSINVINGGITGSLYNEAFSKNRTTTGSVNIIKEYQSIFNPSNLFINENDIFIVEQNAEYYVLGDVVNSGSIVMDGTFKIGGALLNNGSITGNGIIE